MHPAAAWRGFANPAHMLVMVIAIYTSLANGLSLDMSSDESIRNVASTIAYDMMGYYKGNLSGETPGVLPGPPPNPTVTNAGWFWWEAGAMFGSLIDYWYYTGDSTYNDVVMQGMIFQSADSDFLPLNQSNGMGNDDQAFWGMSALTAAELGFPDPPADQPQWLALAQGVFNTQIKKFDELCGGGLHWQAYSYLKGYSYKNSISNGCFFNIAARLAAYTGNDSYAVAAASTWDWTQGIGLIDSSYNVFDGADSNNNCTIIVKQQYSYNAGVFLLGAATMYNYTNGDQIWRDRTAGLMKQILQIFFPDGIAYEVACERLLIHCTVDMLSYKAYLVRWMAAATKVAPFLYDDVIKVIKSSAAAAVLQCSGSPADRPNGQMCGLSWAKGAAWDGTSGVGQQMAALEVVQSILIGQSKSPLTANTGGTSQGNPNAGNSDTEDKRPLLQASTTGGKAGAAILTIVVAVAIVGVIGWVSKPDPLQVS